MMSGTVTMKCQPDKLQLKDSTAVKENQRSVVSTVSQGLGGCRKYMVSK